MKRKLIAGFLAAIMAMGTLAGCGGNSDKGDSKEKTEAKTEEKESGKERK